jgi:hypothetical protein
MPDLKAVPLRTPDFLGRLGGQSEMKGPIPNAAEPIVEGRSLVVVPSDDHDRMVVDTEKDIRSLAQVADEVVDRNILEIESDQRFIAGFERKDDIDIG